MTCLLRTRRRLGPQARLRRQYLHAFAASACVGPFLSYVLSDLGWTPGQIGYANTVLTASAVLTAPAWGWLDDLMEVGAARLSLLATAAAAAFLTYVVGHQSLEASLLAVAVFGSASGSLEALLTSRTLRDVRTADRLGTTRSLGSVGWVVGLGLGGTLLTFTDRPALVFLVAGAAALTAPAPRGRRPRPPRTTPAFGAAQRTASPPPLRAVIGVLSITFPIPLCLVSLIFFTAGWAHSDLGAGPLLAVGPLALAAALELPAFVAADRLARRVSSRTMCGLAFAPMATACAALGVAPGKLMLFGVQPLVALSFALWFVGQSRLIAERVPLARLASGLTLLSTLGRGIAGPVAGIGGGAIAAAGGYPALFSTMAGLCVFGLARVFLFPAHRRPEEIPCLAN